MAKPVFKLYSPTQAFLIPLSFDELIDANHPVRIVNDVVEKIDLKLLEQQYKGGGSSSYHPKMMLKIMVYSYLRNIYSSREISAIVGVIFHYPSPLLCLVTNNARAGQITNMKKSANFSA